MIRGRGDGEQTAVTLTTNDLDKLHQDNVAETDDTHKYTCFNKRDGGRSRLGLIMNLG